MRKDNGWEQTVLLPTSEESLCFLAYHNSQQHAQADNETIFLAVKTQQFNLAWHTQYTDHAATHSIRDACFFLEIAPFAKNTGFVWVQPPNPGN